MSILREEIDRWLSDEGMVAQYREGVHLLERSGIFDILRRLGTPDLIDKGKSLEAMAGQAHQSIGFQSCLDTLLYFERLYIKQNAPVLDPPDFGGLNSAIRKGLIREGEL